MKILMIGSDRSVKGGITSVVNQLLGYHWPDNIKIEYVSTYIEQSNIIKLLFFIKNYINILLKFLFSNIDTIYIHMSYNGSFYRKYYIHKLCKLFNKKTIVHLHGSEFEKFYNNSSARTQKKIRDLLKECDVFIVLGDNWKNVILRIQPLANIIVLPNAVSLPKEMVYRRKESFQILYLGMLIKRKGVSDLIDAIKIINKENFLKKNNVKFIISGIGQEEEVLKRKVQELDLTRYIEFVGWIDNQDKKNFLMESQLLVLPSYNEGLPVAILEAMSYGLPIVSTDVGSISEAVLNNQNGFLITPGDIQGLALSIKKIVECPELWESFSKNSKRVIVSKFNEEDYFKKLINLFNKQLG